MIRAVFDRQGAHGIASFLRSRGSVALGRRCRLLRFDQCGRPGHPDSAHGDPERRPGHPVLDRYAGGQYADRSRHPDRGTIRHTGASNGNCGAGCLADADWREPITRCYLRASEEHGNASVNSADWPADGHVRRLWKDDST